jgi:hypothetical protein
VVRDPTGLLEEGAEDGQSVSAVGPRTHAVGEPL